MNNLDSPPELRAWAGLVGESGSLGGRLSRALGGEEGPEARSEALAALDHFFGWGHPQHHAVQERGQAYWGTRTYLPRELSAWLTGDGVPLLLAAAHGEGDGGDRAKAFRLLRDLLELDIWATSVKDALKAAWAADPAALAHCLYQEPLDEDLACACVGAICVANVRPDWLSDPEPVLTALAAFFRHFRLQDKGAEIIQQLEWSLCYWRPFTAEEVLSHEALSREMAYLCRNKANHRDYRSVRTGLIWTLLGGVEAGDWRLDRFLRQGAAEASVKCLPWDQGVYDNSSRRVARLLEAGVVPAETRALRAQLFRDAGLGELRLSSHDEHRLKVLEARLGAALHLSATRSSNLPHCINF